MQKKMSAFILVIAISLFLYSYNSDKEPLPTANPNTLNDIDVNVLNDLSDKLIKNPNTGQITFFSNTKWQGGMRSITSFAEYKIDGKTVHDRDRRFTLQGDEGTELGGTDSAPGAVEELMYATGTCIAAAANAKAALMGIKLRKLTVSLESDLDLHGLMGLDPNIRPGILGWRTKITIAGNANESTLKKIAMWGYDYSPVSDTVRHGVSKASPPTIIVEQS